MSRGDGLTAVMCGVIGLGIGDAIAVFIEPEEIEMDEQKVTNSEKPDANDLEEKLVERVREWFRRSASDLADGATEVGELTIHLRNPCGDDDGTLYLECDLVEKSATSLEGRANGIDF